jgi:hypothetical protein
MIIRSIKSYSLAACLALGMQSLADIARQEAERRRLLEQQGVEGKVIEEQIAQPAHGENGAALINPSEKQKTTPADRVFPKGRVSKRDYRAELQKLDRAIRQNEERLHLARTRLQAEQRALPKTNKLSASSRTTNPQERLQKEINELQIKLKELHRERTEVYEEGKKAGLLPGELEGRSPMP